MKKRLSYVNFIAGSVIVMTIIIQLSFFVPNMWAKTPSSLRIVEENIKKSKEFHLDIFDGRNIKELTDLENGILTNNETLDLSKQELTDVKRKLILQVPEGIKFDTEAQQTIFQEVANLEEIPEINWNNVDRTVDISMSYEQTSLRIALIAEDSGEYEFELSDENYTLAKEKLVVHSDSDNEAVEAGIDNISNVSDVQSWASFITALSNPAISEINIVEDFQVPTAFSTTGVTVSGSNVTGGAAFAYLSTARISRKVTINGNGHQIDFGAVSLGMTSATHNPNSPWDITFKDLDVYSGNWWGFFQTANLTLAQHALTQLTFHNLNSYGNQMTAPYYSTLNLSGFVNNQVESTYTSKFRTGWSVNTDSSVNIEANNLNILEDAVVNLETLNGGNIILGLGGLQGNLTMEKNASLNLVSRGTEIGSNANATGASISIRNGDLVMKDGAEINIDTTRSYSGLNLAASSSTIDLEARSKINIESQGHTNSTNGPARNLVFMASGSSLIIDSDAELNINASGRGTASSHIINVPGNASFIIGKQGILDIRSDSSAPDQSMLNFGTNGSKFQFADAGRVNLERTAPISDATATNNGLINIGGSGGRLEVDVQKVNMWNIGNYSEDQPSMTFSPIYSLVLLYSGTNPTINSVYSTSSETESNFRNNFSTRNVQRVLFEYIPDVNVDITSISTDEKSSLNSTTVSGITNPGSYIRISDDPVNDSIVPAINISDNIIPSPSTGGGELLTSNFTVQADNNGEFSYTVPSGRYFTAGSTIKVFSFLEGKYDEKTQVVLDKTPPTATPVTYYISVGDELPDPKDMVKDVEDSSPINTGFDFAYTDPDAAAEAARTPGEHTIKINVSDKAVDAQGQPAPNTTVIDSTLVVYAEGSGVSGSNFEASYVDIRDLSESELIAYIVEKTKAEAFMLSGGVRTDLSDFVSVSDFGGLNDIANIQPKEYTITLVVKAADSGLSEDITGTIKVTVVDVDAVLTVEFINEINQLFPGYTIKINGQVGDQIDLTKEEQVIKQLADLESAGYEIVERPENEMAISINNTEVTVRYKLQGVLSLASAPSNLDFGSLTYNATTKRVDNPDVDQPLIVTDTRAETANGWTLTASLSTPMRNSEGQELINALRYVYKGEETILDTNAQTVFLNTEGSAGRFNISDSWGNQQGTDGVKLQIGSADTIHTGSYVGVITWKVMAG